MRSSLSTRIANIVSHEKFEITIKSFIESQFQYCSLVWMFHNRTLSNKINRLHEKVLRLFYEDPSLTLEELLIKDKSFTIHHRNLRKLATEMYKFNNNLSHATMKFIFEKSNNPNELRCNNFIKVITSGQFITVHIRFLTEDLRPWFQRR